MFEVAGCTILLVHPDCVELADQVLSDVHRHVTIVMPEQSDVVALAARWPRFRVLGHGTWNPRTLALLPPASHPTRSRICSSLPEARACRRE
jgi:hypothetical protein